MKKKRAPLRMCIGCQEMKPKKELLRIVKGSDGVIVIDDTGKMPGRGAYLCRESECYNKAVKGKKLQKAYRIPVSNDIYAEIKEQMEGVDDRQ